MMQQPSRRVFLQRSVSAGAGAACALASLTASAGPRRFQPRLAICNETFGNDPFGKACATAAACGYEGIEIAPFTLATRVTDISAARRQELRQQARQAGLEVVGLHWLLAKTEGLLLTSPDAAVRHKTADYLGALAHFCADLGGRVLVFGSPKQRNLLPGISRAAGMKYAADVFQAVAPVLEATGVTIGLEPLAPDTTNFVTTAAEAVALLSMVASPRCRLHLDCLAMSTEATPIPELIRLHRAMLVHFHANDPNGLGPGMGRLDFHPILQALADIQYSGWVSVEVFDYKPGGQRVASDSMRYLRQCLSQ